MRVLGLRVIIIIVGKLRMMTVMTAAWAVRKMIITKGIPSIAIERLMMI
jgi:hypothetical protein